MFSFTVNKVFLFIFFSFCSYNLFFYINPTPKIKSDLHIFSLKINHLSNPFGIDIHNNSFSFLTDMEGPFRAFLISLDNNNKTTHSKKLFLKNCHSFYFDKPLEYQTSYIFRVETNNYYNEIKFETAAKLNAPFIKPKNDKIESPIFFKEFEVNKKYNINKARLYITGLGLYQAYINNQKVGKGYLTPGFNDYDFYLRYQTYDIYDLIQEKNVIEVHMGNGWYKGRFGLTGGSNIFGNEYKLCLMIYLEYNTGFWVKIYSDENWKVKKSYYIKNNIYDGEIIDFTLNNINDYENKVIITKENYNLIPDYGALIEEKEIIKPKLYKSSKNELILDFGQNIVGFIRYKGYLKKNTILKLSHGEILQNGSFYNLNYRSAESQVKYISDGKNRIYEPKFSYFGFRYVKVEGIERDQINTEQFEGVVLYTNLEQTILYDSFDKKINKLINNAFRSQKGNFLDVPTDCPQRDERLGWTGDAQVFSNTGCYNMDSYIFYKKFMDDLRIDQINYYRGDIPAYSPSLKGQSMPGGAVWSDAGTIIPWNIYLNYGDINLLKNSYTMMKDYVETLISKDKLSGNSHLLLDGFTFGDWLALDGTDPSSNFGGTDHGFIMTVYYYHSVDIISNAAKELGYLKDYSFYYKLKNDIYNSLLEQYFEKDGKLKLDTQTAYVLCLYYNIYKKKDIIIKDFKKKLEEDLFHIQTGFTGTPLILLTLFDNNMDEYAYRILYNENFPGWLYAINLGATSIWERWDSLTPNGTITANHIVSFNHYAYGSVVEAIYSRIGGLINLAPGWKKVLIKPHINFRRNNFYLSFMSISGKYIIDWEISFKKKFIINIVIPNGCEAELILPNGKKYKIKNGKYKFECDLNDRLFYPFSINSPIIDILYNENSKEIMKKYVTKIYEIAKLKADLFNVQSISKANSFYNFNYSKDILNKCDEELKKIPLVFINNSHN